MDGGPVQRDPGHITDHLAFGYDQAVQLLQDVGVKEIAVFEKRQRRLEPLG